MTKQLAIFFTLSLLSLSIKATDDETRQVMRRATQYMMDEVSYKGGFVWNYLPDHSRQWGELEARRTMVWLQTPSTPDMGEVLLDAYHATGDEYYYESAKRVALCIIRGQLPCGGWNYMFDLEPEDSLKTWYETNLCITIKYGDARDSQHNLLYMNYRPKYYILGLSNSAQTSNKALPQTIGWQDYNNGGAAGTFDPLAE